ncbi:mucin-22-like, partial [Clarias magur]
LRPGNQHTVQLGYSDPDLSEETVQTQTCPSSTPGPVHQVPAVKCESTSMTVTLAAKKLIETRFV